MIDAAVWFALLSLVLGGLNEVVFKYYSAVLRSRGMMIAGVGVVWAVLLGTEMLISDQSIVFERVGFGYALAAGLAVALANILLLESLRHAEIEVDA